MKDVQETVNVKLSKHEVLCRFCACALLACLLSLSSCGEADDEDGKYTIQYNEEITNAVFAPALAERRDGEIFDTLEFTLAPDSGKAELALCGDEVLTGTLSGLITPVTTEAGDGYGCNLNGQVNGETTSYSVVVSVICSDSDAFATLTIVRADSTNLMCVYGELNNTIEAINEAYREYLSELE